MMKQAILLPECESTPSVPGYPCVFSDDRIYRYVLWRVWENHQWPRYCAFIGLNPSTADETVDDPTIRRCVGFAKSWGYDALAMLNLFAFRATAPADMKDATSPIGEENDKWLAHISAGAQIVVAAWGNHGAHLGRANAVVSMIPRLHCMRVTAARQPQHPLYIAADTKLEVYHGN